MEKKKLNNGVEIPVLGFGTWQIEKEEATKAVAAALKIGYRHIDTAFAYYNEKYIQPSIKNFTREELFITSKLWRDFHDPKLVEKGCDSSLQDLQTDYLDLYLMHWPDKENMLDVYFAMQNLIEKGKVKSIGVCNATEHHLEDLLSQKFTVSMNQVEFHPFLNQQSLLDYCNKKKIAVTAYCPIAQGRVFKDKTIIEIANSHGKTPAQISLRWLLQKNLVVIPKASSEAHAKENFAIFDFQLTDEEMKKINSLHNGRRIVNPDFQEFDY